ncbi:hypothetical protein [Janthinobacterium sp. HLX7-2]|uniref:hypothetical protein n=1 Tax=Janthinobacterium sp. HLX7-2 TaxID=1259331 RepID=UPI003F232EB2
MRSRRRFLRGNANNLADKVYRNHTLTSFVPDAVNGDTVIIGQGRTVGASYTVQF